MPQISAPDSRLSTPLLVERVLEREKVGGGHSQTLDHQFQLLERRRVSSPLNQAEEVYGHTDHLCEFLLALLHLVADLPNPLPELRP